MDEAVAAGHDGLASRQDLLEGRDGEGRVLNGVLQALPDFRIPQICNVTHHEFWRVRFDGVLTPVLPESCSVSCCLGGIVFFCFRILEDSDWRWLRLELFKLETRIL